MLARITRTFFSPVFWAAVLSALLTLAAFGCGGGKQRGKHSGPKDGRKEGSRYDWHLYKSDAAVEW
ncbi:MAG: hypothetical protein D8M22_06235, partial [Armatimonadetes bacterium]|nr:hypothetical protein [Armatimonadota bacterium]